MSKQKRSDGSQPLNTAQREKFAKLCVAEEMTTAEAYVEAGYAHSPTNARRMKTNEKVAARIRYLKRKEGAAEQKAEEVAALREKEAAEARQQALVKRHEERSPDKGWALPERAQASGNGPSPDLPLTNARQEKFAQLVAKGRPAARAYEDAGYNPSDPNASRMRAEKPVAARIRYLQTQGAKKAELEASFVLRSLVDNYQRSIGEMPVQTGVTKADGSPFRDENGNEMLVQRHIVDLKAGNKALELLGKTLAMFADVKAELPFKDLSNDDLREQVRKLISGGRQGEATR